VRSDRFWHRGYLNFTEISFFSESLLEKGVLGAYMQPVQLQIEDLQWLRLMRMRLSYWN
jgi:hypothetical protein